MEKDTMLFSLPPEVIFHIASFLDLASLYCLAGTCSMLSYVSHSNHMFCTSFYNKWQFFPPNHHDLLTNNFGEMLKWNHKLNESKTLLEGNQNFIVFMVQNGKIIGDSLNSARNHKFTASSSDTGGGMAFHVDLVHAPWDIIFVFSKKKMAYMNDFGVYINFSKSRLVFLPLPCTTGRAGERLFGPGAIILSLFSSLFMYYLDDDDHTFTSVDITDEYYICRRSVMRWYDAEAGMMLLTHCGEFVENTENFLPALYLVIGERSTQQTQTETQNFYIKFRNSAISS